MAEATSTVTMEIGSSGLKRWGGFVAEEFLRELRGPRGMKVYREMRDNSDVVGACLGAIEMLIRQVKWSVEPAEGDTSREGKERAEFVEQCRCDMSVSWQETVTEQLSMLTYGFAPCELVYKERRGDTSDPSRRSRFSDGRIGWRKIALRSQETIVEWKFDAAGGVQGFFQVALPDLTRRFVPIEKALLFKARSEKGNPEGRSVLRNAYFSWYFSKKITELEGIGIARDLTGIPVGWLPPDCFGDDASEAGKATFAAMQKIVTSMERDEQEGILLPLDYNGTNKRYDLTLLSTGGRRQFDTTSILQRYDRKIAQMMMHDIIIMGEPNTVTYKGKSVPNLFATALGGWLDMLAEVYNSHAIPRLMGLNGWPTDKPAQLKHGKVEIQDLGTLGTFITAVVQAGFPWHKDKGVDAHLRKASDLPSAPPGLEADDAPPPPVAPVPPSAPPPAKEED